MQALPYLPTYTLMSRRCLCLTPAAHLQARPPLYCTFALMFILVMPIEHGLNPVFDIKSHAMGLDGYSTDQISTSGKADGFNWF